MISEKYLEAINQSAFSMLDKLRVIFNDGSEKDLKISHYEVKADYFKVLGYLQDDMVGDIREVQALLKDGGVGISKAYSLKKTRAHGTMVMMKVRIREEEVL